MTRATISVRDASEADTPVLARLWHDALRPGTAEEQAGDLLAVLAATATEPRERLVVVECDGLVAGAAFLQAGTVSALNLDPVVHLVSTQVLEEFRRHGAGTALVEAAVAFAEQLGIAHVAVGAAAGSRDANRFMARLGLAPVALVRIGSTAGVRSRLSALRRAGRQGQGTRHLDRVLAARRLSRRDRIPG